MSLMCLSILLLLLSRESRTWNGSKSNIIPRHCDIFCMDGKLHDERGDLPTQMGIVVKGNGIIRRRTPQITTYVYLCDVGCLINQLIHPFVSWSSGNKEYKKWTRRKRVRKWVVRWSNGYKWRTRNGRKKRFTSIILRINWKRLPRTYRTYWESHRLVIMEIRKQKN